MCYEDVQLGLRRWSRTSAPIVGTTSVRGDGSRVGLILSINATTAAPAIAILRRPGGGNIPILVVSETNQNAELWLERHGTLVQEPLEIANNGNAGLTEIFDRKIDSKPVAPTPPAYVAP